MFGEVAPDSNEVAQVKRATGAVRPTAERLEWTRNVMWGVDRIVIEVSAIRRNPFDDHRRALRLPEGRQGTRYQHLHFGARFHAAKPVLGPSLLRVA